MWRTAFEELHLSPSTGHLESNSKEDSAGTRQWDPFLTGYWDERTMVGPGHTEKVHRDGLASRISNTKMASGPVACPGPRLRLSLLLFPEFCVPLVSCHLCPSLTQTSSLILLILLLQCDQQPWCPQFCHGLCDLQPPCSQACPCGRSAVVFPFP